MLKRNLWKLIVTAAALVWAAAEIIPLQDVPFTDYVRTHATAKQAELGKLLDEAAARKKNLQAASEYVALKQIGKERKIDLSQFFPDINLEANLRSVEKRNDILLCELLRRSKGRVQLGLDLNGGVAFTLETVDRPGDTDDKQMKREKLTKAIDIIGKELSTTMGLCGVNSIHEIDEKVLAE